jgi:hypothetical protein
MAESERFGVVRTLASGFAVFARNLGVVALLGVLPFAISASVLGFQFSTAAPLAVEGALYAACIIADILFVASAMARAIGDLEDRRPAMLTLFRMAARSLLRILPLFLVVIALMAIAELIIAPAPQDVDQLEDLMLLGFWLVVLPFCLPSFPAIVVEELGPIAGIRRGLELSKGNRLKLFAILALGCLAYSQVAGFVSFMVRDRVIDVAMEFVFLAIGASITGAIYHRLRELKEGGRLGREFD